ncbi:NADP-dependent malic enzyme [Seminavis robusta]|uniref:Malic enzyme n=1 Tax=Seminavis robusta TaxID=568900 RepID=A0A9N8F136_9STRA|nr:NADP-dependent malic enzyme [Seminavis robusta]|eukprot:Sro2516_g329910.1 NADP-dependent malic enzyme (561) ;mRNA; f:905-2776
MTSHPATTTRRYSRLTFGVYHAKDPVKYNGVSTPVERRTDLGIQGLVPAAFVPLELDVQRCMEQLRSKATPLEKYIYLQSIQDVSERLYYAILVAHTAEVMPIVYTPTVGAACENFSKTYRGTLRGMYFSLKDAGNIRKIFDNWPSQHVTTIVVTDGERILGLGDLGVNGMGIPIGKLALYTACAGIHPAHVLPVQLDVGTNNEKNIQDPYYLGLKQPRERGPAYDALVTEFFEAAMDKFGEDVLIQFEDFGNLNAFRLLDAWKDKACTFNDDIQGTASVAVGGLLASEKLTGKKLSEHTFLFSGAGEAGTGIAELMAYAISIELSIPVEDARKKIYLVDSKGLVTKSRLESLQHHKLNFAHDVADCKSLKCAIDALRPSAIIGVSAMPGTFDKEVCEKMAQYNEHPIIAALSNPTSKAECTAEQAYTWTNGKAIFSSGSPFAPVTLADGRRFVSGQGNNAYIFPGIGLGRLAACSTRITNHDMYLAAKVLSEQVTQQELDVGCLYPPLSKIREVSAHIAVAIAKNAHETGVATEAMPENLMEHVKSLMYDPFEDPYVEQ